MKHKKSILLFLLISLFVFSPLAASSAMENVKETVIENGLTVFTLEDYSSPLVRIEVCIRAGFSSQNAQNAGFAKLLTQLIEKAASVKFEVAECNADSIRFSASISPSEIPEFFYNISESIFNPVFSDRLLSANLETMKREVLQNASDSSSLINSSIDARIFSSEPWRNDSGIYPSLFNKLTENEARKILFDFHNDYFVPGNAAIFVSGNIDGQDILKNVQKTFGRFYSSRKVSFQPLGITPPSRDSVRKFVIHAPDFSEDFTQIVMQFSSMSETEAALASAVYNDDYSEMKQALCFCDELNIPGPEYVNAAKASKSGSSRLIIQSLLQKGKSFSPVEQVALFTETVRKNTEISYADFETAVSRIRFNFNRTISSSTDFMEQLCSLWAVLPYEVSVEGTNLSEIMNDKLVSSIQQCDAGRIPNAINNEEPFVFVIMNSKQYKAHKKAFTEAGFEQVYSANGSWYTNNLYKNVKSLRDLVKQNTALSPEEKPDYSKVFYDQSRETILEHTLSNGIPLVIKQNKNTTGVTFLLAIEGGKWRTADDHGFEEVMTNILTMNIMRQIQMRKNDGLILNDYEINAETDLNSSRIVVECETEDFYAVVNALYASLIMDDVIPSDADRIVNGRRTRKRLENGSTMNQLYSSAVQSVFPETDFIKIYETKKEILENTNYEKILVSYSGVLDASRYSIIVCGNIEPENYIQMMEDAFGQLQVMNVNNAKKENESIADAITKKQFTPGKTQKVKLVHTFLTDIPAKDAGPMPAVLIPTKSFADPVLFCAETSGENETALNALLSVLKKELEAEAAERNYLQNCKVSFYNADSNISFGALAFSSVERTSACDSLYKQEWESLKDRLSNTKTSARTLDFIKTVYISDIFAYAHTNTGAARLMYLGVKENKGAGNYLELYKDINALTAEKLLEVLENSLSFDKLFKLYSSDAKK